MNLEQQSAILTIALYASFADGIKDDREREQVWAEKTARGRI